MKMKVRNTSGRARTEAVMVRLSSAEMEAARAKAMAVGVSLSELVRQLLAGLKPRARKRVAVEGLPEVRRIAALLGHALRSADPAERAQLVPFYKEACRRFGALLVQAERLQEAEDGHDVADHQES